MNIRSKELTVRAEAVCATPAHLQLINQLYALEPLSADQVYVRRLALCNDQYDRTGERFPPSYLQRFAETLPGKPLLAHHEKACLPLGRFFQAAVVHDAAPEDLAASTQPGEATWLHCWVYLVKTPANEELRRQIDAGVYSHVSIGFRWAELLCDVCGGNYFGSECPHLIGQVYEGRRATATYGGNLQQVEAVEASLVYLGAQYGAVITKSDDRAAEKRRLGPPQHASPPEEDGLLAQEGRSYRQELRHEILRLAGAVEAEEEARMLLEALGDAPAARLADLREIFAARFDAVFPPVIGPGARASPPPARQEPPRRRHPLGLLGL